MSCLDEDRLGRFLEGGLAEAELAAVEAHLDGCEACRRLLGAAARADDTATSSDDTAPPASRVTRIGPFEVVALIGVGGMGEVYRARDARLGRDVAIKVLTARMRDDASWRQRFEREARAIGRLNHPNVLSVFDLGWHEGSPYVVTELLDGDTLRARLRSGVTAREAVELGAEIAAGVAAAHDEGIVHRDLKPENVFVTRDGRVKILDFGLARDDGPAGVGDAAPPTTPGAILGTAGYMSPEQARGQRVDARSDVFSLGVLLYELLAGQRAFTGSHLALLRAVIDDPPPAFPADRTPAPAVAAVVRRCLEKDPAARYPSAREVEQALREAVEGRSEASTGRRRWRRQAIAAGVVAALLAAVAVVVARRGGATRGAAPSSASASPSPSASASASASSSASASASASAAASAALAPTVASSTERRRVTAGTGDAAVAHAALAPDGTLAAYTDWRGRTFVAVVATGDAHELSLPREVAALAWQPDGVGLLALLCADADDDCRLAQVPAFGGEVRELARAPRGALVPLGAAGVALAAGSRVLLVDERGEQRPLFELDADEGIHAIAASPDGRWLACYRVGEARLHVVDARRGVETGVLPAPVRITGLAWTGARRLLVGTDEARTQTAVSEVVLDDDGRPAAPRRRFALDGWAELTGATRDGGRVAYLRRERRVEAYVAPLDERGLGTARLLGDDAFADTLAMFTRDGRAVLASSARRDGFDGYDVVLVPIDGGAVRVLAAGERPTLAPDGAAALFLRRADVDGERTRWTLWRVALTGGAPTLLHELGVHDHRMSGSIACAPGAARCLWRELGPGVTRSHWLDLATGAQTPVPGLPDSKQWTVVLAPDGQRVARTPDGRVVEVVELDDGARRELAHEGCFVHRLAWTPDGRAVLAACQHRGFGANQIVRYDLDGAGRRVVSEQTLDLSQLAVSPDGARLAFNLTELGGQLWVIDDR